MNKLQLNYMGELHQTPAQHNENAQWEQIIQISLNGNHDITSLRNYVITSLSLIMTHSTSDGTDKRKLDNFDVFFLATLHDWHNSSITHNLVSSS